MSKPIYKQQEELAHVIKHYSQYEGLNETAIPSLFFIRRSTVTGPKHGVYKPSLCIIVQGAKDVWLAQERFRYSPADYLVASLDLPVTSEVVEASSDAPYLALNLVFTPEQVLDVLRDSEIQGRQKKNAKRGIYVSPTELTMLDAVIRLVRLLDKPKDISILAPPLYQGNSLQSS